MLCFVEIINIKTKIRTTETLFVSGVELYSRHGNQQNDGEERIATRQDDVMRVGINEVGQNLGAQEEGPCRKHISAPRDRFAGVRVPATDKNSGDSSHACVSVCNKCIRQRDVASKSSHLPRR